MMDEEKLIIAVQNRSVIFDKGDKNHHNRDVISSMWDCIAKEVGYEVNACKKRWNSLRDYFLKKYRETKITKSGQAASKKRKWYLYEAMSFLIPYYCSQETDGNLIYTDEGDQQEEEPEIEEATSQSGSVSLSSEESFPSEQFRKPQGSKKRKKDCTTVSTFDMEVLKALKEPEIVEENELFFKSLIPSLKRLNDIQRMEFRLEVQGLLLKYLRHSVQTPAAVPSSSGYSSCNEHGPELQMSISQNLSAEEYYNTDHLHTNTSNWSRRSFNSSQ